MSDRPVHHLDFCPRCEHCRARPHHEVIMARVGRQNLKMIVDGRAKDRQTIHELRDELTLHSDSVPSWANDRNAWIQSKMWRQRAEINRLKQRLDMYEGRIE